VAGARRRVVVLVRHPHQGQSGDGEGQRGGAPSEDVERPAADDHGDQVDPDLTRAPAGARARLATLAAWALFALALAEVAAAVAAWAATGLGFDAAVETFVVTNSRWGSPSSPTRTGAGDRRQVCFHATP
jgi:hypothetical protein